MHKYNTLYTAKLCLSLIHISAMNTDSATGPSDGPKVWKDSPGCSEKMCIRDSGMAVHTSVDTLSLYRG